MTDYREEQFLNKARKIITTSLIKAGIVMLHPEELDNVLIEIGKNYYELEKEEEL